MSADFTNAVAVVSLHERGFWQADLYLGAREWDIEDWLRGPVPDTWLSGRTGGDRDEVVASANKYWPGAEIRDAADDEDEDDGD